MFTKNNRKNLKIILFIYVLVLLFAKLRLTSLVSTHYASLLDRINLVPFKTLSRYIMHFDKYNRSTLLYNTVYYLLSFIPIGFLSKLAFINTKATKIIAVFLVLYIVIYLALTFTGFSYFDIDKIMLALVGFWLGCVIAKPVDKLITKKA